MNTRIKAIRTGAGMTQDAFAGKIGITRNYVSLLESGDREPSETVLRAICREFRVDYDWLVTGVGDMHPSQSDTDIEIITRAMEGQSEGKKKLIRMMAEMPDELLDRMLEYLESKK